MLLLTEVWYLSLLKTNFLFPVSTFELIMLLHCSILQKPYWKRRPLNCNWYTVLIHFKVIARSLESSYDTKLFSHLTLVNYFLLLRYMKILSLMYHMNHITEPWQTCIKEYDYVWFLSIFKIRAVRGIF